MYGNLAYVVIDRAEDGSVVGIYGPFDDEESANTWEGPPGGPHGSCSTHQLFEPPEWLRGYTDAKEGDPIE